MAVSLLRGEEKYITIFQLNCHRFVGAFHEKTSRPKSVQKLKLDKKLSTIQVCARDRGSPYRTSFILAT